MKKPSLIIIAFVAVILVAVLTGAYFAAKVSADAHPNPQPMIPGQMSGYEYNYTYYPYYGGYGMGMGMMGMGMMSPMYYPYGISGYNYSYYDGYGMGMMGMGMYPYYYGAENYTYPAYGYGMGMMGPAYYYGINATMPGYYYPYNYTYYSRYGMGYPYDAYNDTYYPGYYGGCGMGMGMYPYYNGMNSGYYSNNVSPTPSPSVDMTYSSMKGKAIYLSDGADSDVPSSASAPASFISSPYAVAGLGIGFLAFAPITWKLLHRRPKI
jgi:hypothetical protein